MTGADIGASFVPFNAESNNGGYSWASGVNASIVEAGFELDYIQGATPEAAVAISPSVRAGFSVSHMLMKHTLYEGLR
ncbi:hypothetical protein [Agarivorans aestuarii]|uniref:hypothetical protein n=1 Tax=Agarivorans aestuarii TaxID=1563703 RepID=UPI001C80BD34|nr:hypothetical protein [Agarivorans aestuarii]